MTRLSIDLKVMARYYKGQKIFLVVIDEVTNFMVTIPIYQSRSEEIGDALIEHVFSKYSIPECMIMDQDSAIMSALINNFFKELGIKIKTLAIYNHQFYMQNMEYAFSYHIHEIFNRIRTTFAMCSYNTFCSPNLNWFSPYKLVFG